MSKKDNQQIGIAGENFVVAELNNMDFIATITGKNTKAVDILCLNQKTYRQTFIQVKTTKIKLSNKSCWPLNVKNEKLINDNFYYVFVILNSKGNDYFVVPSKVVAETIYKEHRTWLNEPGKNHKDTNIRGFRFCCALPYKNKWNLLE